MGGVKRHVSGEQQAQNLMVSIQTSGQGGLERQRVVAQNALRSQLQGLTHRGGRGVQTDGQNLNLASVRGYLQPGQIPGRGGLQRCDFFNGAKYFRELH